MVNSQSRDDRLARRLAGAVVAMIVAAPFLEFLSFYLDGRWGLKLVSFCLPLIVGVLGLGAVVLILSPWMHFKQARGWARLGFALGLLVGGPAWFILCIGLGPRGIDIEVRGMADAVRSQIDVVALRAWATQQLQTAPSAASNAGNSAESQALPWATVPADVRGFLGDDKLCKVSIRPAGLNCVSLERFPRALLVGRSDFRMASRDYCYVEPLEPGVFFQYTLFP